MPTHEMWENFPRFENSSELKLISTDICGIFSHKFGFWCWKGDLDLPIYMSKRENKTRVIIE